MPAERRLWRRKATGWRVSQKRRGVAGLLLLGIESPPRPPRFTAEPRAEIAALDKISGPADLPMVQLVFAPVPELTAGPG